MAIQASRLRHRLEKYGLILLIGNITADASANKIRDTIRLKSTGIPSSAFTDSWVRFTGYKGSVAPGPSELIDGNLVKVDYLDQDNGDLYLSPDLLLSTGSVYTGTSGAAYEIWRPGIFVDEVDRATDLALTTLCSQWAYHPITLIRNPLYEADDRIYPFINSIAGWTRVNSTIAIQAHQPNDATLWRQYIEVTTTASNGYLGNDGILNLPGGAQFYLYVPVRAVTGNARVIVRDNTNGGDITLSGTSTITTGGWTGIEVTGTVPATCRSLSVRLQGDSNGAVTLWGPVFLHQVGARTLPIPMTPYLNKPLDDQTDGVTDADGAGTDAHSLSDTAFQSGEDDIGPVFEMSNYATPSSTKVGEEDLREVPNVRRTSVFSDPMLRFGHPIANKPHVAQMREFFPPLGDHRNYYSTTGAISFRTQRDAVLTYCNGNYVAAATAKLVAELMLKRKPQEAEFYSAVLQQAEADYTVFNRRFGARDITVKERERSIYIPQLEV